MVECRAFGEVSDLVTVLFAQEKINDMVKNEVMQLLLHSYLEYEYLVDQDLVELLDLMAFNLL